jgi:protein SCO1/2
MKKLLIVAIGVSVFASSYAAELTVAEQTTIVEALGRLNGRALACGYPELVSRTKAIVTARVAKTRELGEAFERTTQIAFLAQGKEKIVCPSRPALALELDATARPLSPPPAHQLTDSPDMPDVGINPRYLLQATNGRAVMDSDFPNHFQLITFGYTFCPDVCPTTLLEIAAVMKQLGDQASRVQPLFFSVDPERDTLAHLRTYTGFFDPRILGATGSAELVKRTASNFKVRYEKVSTPGASPDHYAVDHSAGMFLLAPGGNFIAKFAYATPVADIVTRMKNEIEKRAVRAAESKP